MLDNNNKQWMDKVNYYFARASASYSIKSASGFWKFFRTIELKSIAAALDLKSADSILDCGCGTGFYSKWILQFTKNLVSIDANSAMVSESKKIGIDARHTEIHHLENQAFDKILIAGVLEFAAEPNFLLESAQARLKEGGRIVVLHPKNGFFGWIYFYIHTIWGCPLHPSSKISSLVSGSNWKTTSAGILANCSVWKKDV